MDTIVNTYKLPEIKVNVVFDQKAKKSELYKVSCSGDLHRYFQLAFDQNTIDWTEEMILFCLNRANKIIGFYKLSKGGMTGTVVDVKVMFTIALNCTATSIAIAHNHPSGNLSPSEEDIKLTKKVREAGKLMDITLLDHLILADNTYYSFADQGYMY